MGASGQATIDLAKSAIAAVVTHWRQAMKISAVWYGFYMICWVAQTIARDPYGQHFALSQIEAFALGGAGIIGSVIAFGSIAVAWHTSY